MIDRVEGRMLPGEVEPQGGGEALLDLRGYWHTLRSRAWSVVLVALLVLAVAVASAFLVRPVYRSVTTLRIERENPNILSFEEVQVIDARRDDFYETHHLLLQSRTLAQRVIQKLGLELHPDFVDPAVVAAGETPPLTILATRLQEMIDVKPVGRSRLVAIGVEAHDRQLAADIANAIASTYIEMSAEAKYEASEEATEFLSNQIDALKIEIEDKKEGLQDYAQQNRIVALDKDKNIVVQRLTDLNGQLTKTQSERMQLESRYHSLKQMVGVESASAANRRSPPPGATLWRVPEVANNQLLQTLRGSLAQLKSQYSEMGQRFADDWPAMIRMRERMRDLNGQIRREEWNIVVGMLKDAEARYNAAVEREGLLTEQLESQKGDVTEMNRSAILYNTLQAEVDTKLKLLDSLLKRKSETDVSVRLNGLKSSNVRVVDRAEPPLGPIRPNKLKNAIVGLFLGVGLGVGFGFLLEYIDNTIKSVEDVEWHTGLPSFGVIPLFAGEQEEQPVLAAGEAPEGTTSLVTLRQTPSAVAEAYRALRTSLLMSSPGSAPRILLITSSKPGEGKTTTVVNTAIALAQAGKQVLLIDADLRKPRCHALVDLKNEVGLSTYLTEARDLKELVQPGPVPNLSVMTSGPIPPNPSELLGSARMSELLHEVPPGIDHILLDSPPVLWVTDPALLATLVDGVVVVVRAGTTPWPLLKRTQSRLRHVNAKIVGVVLNSVDVRGGGGYYSYNDYYETYGEDKPS